MLSATQGKYELERSSVTFRENINYIYYFKYFHKFDIHPFWDKFKEEFGEKKIKDKVEELKGYVECLQKMHESLKESVSTCSDPKNLIEKSVKTIECDIDTIYKILNCYVVEELRQIPSRLQCKKLKFEQQLKCSCPKLSSEISFVKKTLRITTKITYTFKTIIETMSKIKDGSTYEIQQVIEEFTQKSEETKESRTERRLKSICYYIKKLLLTTKSLPNLSDLTCDNFDKYQEKIKDIEKYINELDCAIEYIKEKKRKIKNTENITITERLEGRWKKIFSKQEDALKETYTELQLSYQKEVTKIENLIKVKRTISELLKDVSTEIGQLVEQVNCFKTELSKVKEQLERLKYIKFLNEELKGHNKLTGQLRKIRGFAKMIEDIKPGTKSTEQIKINLTRFITNKYYYISVNLVKRTVDSLLGTLESNRYNEIKDACPVSVNRETQGSSNPHLQNAKSALECVEKNLCNLKSIGNNMGDLIRIRPTITELLVLLQNFDSVMSTLHKELKQLGGQPHTTSQKLDIMTRFRDVVEKEITTMERYIDEIEAISVAGKEITKLYNEYQSYTAAFRDFNEKLEQLETCLDYLMERFLGCSLCTTICNLKRQLRDSYTNSST